MTTLSNIFYFKIYTINNYEYLFAIIFVRVYLFLFSYFSLLIMPLKKIDPVEHHNPIEIVTKALDSSTHSHLNGQI